MAWSINSDNGQNGNPAVWDRCRSLWNGAGIQNFPWFHARNLKDVERLIAVGEQYDSPAIGLNIENVVEDFINHGVSLQDIAQKLAAWTKPVHMATLCWVQNGQGWGALARVVAALEIFIDEVPACKDIQGCIDHALEEGLPNVTLMLKTKPPNSPATYGTFFSICHSLYTADDITPTAEAWSAWEFNGSCVAPMPEKKWYEKPYLTGPPVGPEKLPRPLYPPSAGKGTFSGNDVTAYKRGISRAGRLLPWSPSTWSKTYGETFAVGEGSGNVGKSGVRGFQRQTWPNDKSMQTGNLGDKTYQAMRRALISDPSSPHYKDPIFDAEAIKLLTNFKPPAPPAPAPPPQTTLEKVQGFITEFCNKGLANPSGWNYSQSRPIDVSVDPSKSVNSDCSGSVIQAYYYAKTKTGLAVKDPSKQNFSGYGNTDIYEDDWPTVTGSYVIGDLAHYSGHVTLCMKSGTWDTSDWWSFGSEPPSKRKLNYRSDFRKVVRPVIL